MKRRLGLRIAAIVLALLMSAVLFCACGAESATDSKNEAIYGDSIPGSTGDFTTTEDLISKENSANADSRKLIKTVNLDLQTKEFDAFANALAESVSANGGYIEAQRENMRSSYNYRFASYTVRIPADKLDAFVGEVSELATVTSKSSDLDDITGVYIDTESRIKSLETELDSLRALLAKAETLSDIMSIQQRISEVQSQLDSYKATLKAYENQVAYSTVNITVDEVERTTEVGKGFWATVGDNIADNFGILFDGLREAAIFLLSAIPFLIIPVIIITVVVIICVKRIKKAKKADEYKDELK